MHRVGQRAGWQCKAVFEISLLPDGQNIIFKEDGISFVRIFVALKLQHKSVHRVHPQSLRGV